MNFSVDFFVCSFFTHPHDRADPFIRLLVFTVLSIPQSHVTATSLRFGPYPITVSFPNLADGKTICAVFDKHFLATIAPLLRWKFLCNFRIVTAKVHKLQQQLSNTLILGL